MVNCSFPATRVDPGGESRETEPQTVKVRLALTERELLWWDMPRRAAGNYRPRRGAFGKFRDHCVVPPGHEAHVRICNAHVFLSCPQLLRLIAGPAHATAVFPVKMCDSHLIQKRWRQLETILVFVRIVLPADSDEYPFWMTGLIEQILYGPLALEVTITRQQHKNTRQPRGGKFSSQLQSGQAKPAYR